MRLSACIAIWSLAAASAFAALPDGLRLGEDGDRLTFTNGVVKLSFAERGLRLTGYGPAGGEPVVTGGRAEVYRQDTRVWEAGGGAVEAIETTAEDGAGVLRVTAIDGPWRATHEWRLWPGSTVAARQTHWTYAGEAGGEVGNTRFVADGVALPGAPDAAFVIPTAFPPQEVPFAEIQLGRRRGVPWAGSNNALVVVRSPAQDRAVLLASIAAYDGPWANVEERADSVAVEHGFATRLLLTPGARFGARWQVFALAGASLDAIVERSWETFERLGLRASESPADADGAVIYSAHVGGTIGSGFRDTGGFAAFSERLPYLRDLGVSVLWLLPFWNGHVYAPIDYGKLDESLGSEAELKALVDRAHGLGMKVVGDLIPHGPLKESGLLEQHPDWVSRQRDGEPLFWWGCLSCDYAHPGWQQFMADHAVDWMRRVGLDGYRVDCAAGGPPNWRPYGELWPSLSGPYGARRMLALVREAMQREKPGSLLIPEGTASWLCESGDYVYDFPWSMAILPQAIELPLAQFAPAAEAWLDWQRALYPRGGRLMRFASSHDMVRGLWQYGPDLHRALLALNALIPGAPMIYDEEEMGHAAALAPLLRLRAALPALASDPVDYDAATADDPRVIAFLRGDRAPVLAAVNLASQTIRTTIRLTAPLPPGMVRCLGDPAADRLGADGAVEVRLGPGEAAVWATAAGTGPSAAPPAPRAAPEVAGLRLRSGAAELVVSEAEGGRILLVSAPGAALTDERLAEGRRKLFLGVPPIDFGRAPTERGATEGLELAGHVTVPGADRPAVDFVRRYRVDHQGGFRVETVITPRVDLERANAQLVQSFELGPSPQVTIHTLEGELRYGPRWPPPRNGVYEGARYRHPVGTVLWESCRLPLAPDGLWVGGESGLGLGELGASRPEWLQNVRLSRAAGADGQPTTRLEIAWLDGREPVTLRAGESVTLSFRLLTTPAQTAPSWTVEGSNYVFENAHYRLVLGRGAGGSIRELRARRGDGWGPNLIGRLRSYTDVGLYADWRDPLGQPQRSVVASDGDLEPDVAIHRDGDRLTVAFVGTVRGAYGGGLHVQHPYSWYRHELRLDSSSRIGLRLGFRPRSGYESIALPAFVAHTIDLRGVRHWRASGADQVSERDAAPQMTQRCWQSREHGGLAADGITIDAAGGTLRVRPGPGAERLQNVFLFDAGGGAMTLFLAPFDLEPAPAPPVWVESEWSLEL